jgi:hypothetical protein
MSFISRVCANIVIAGVVFVIGCAPAGNTAADQPNNGPANTQKANKVMPVQPSDGTIPSGTGVEKEKPAAGKANVQGKAMFNDQPAVGVQVKLCQTFSQYGSGCGGEVFTAKTDEAGEYLIKDVPPGLYEGLTVQVFDTPFYVFATSGYVSAAKYKLEEGKTYFAPDSHLFKNDLKLTSPKAGAKVAAENIEVKWDAYPDAAYYKYSIHGDSASGAETDLDFVGKRVDDTSVTLDKPLKPGTYSPKVEAYNANDRRLAQSSQDMKFTVTGGAAK